MSPPGAPPDRKPPERRVRVTSPQTRIALARRHRPAQQLLPVIEETMGEAELAAARAMFAAQRRLVYRTFVLLGTLLLGLSGLLAALPVLDQRVIGVVPVSWLLLMAGSYPLLLVIAALHVRATERIEDRGDPRAGGPTEDRAGTGNGTGSGTGTLNATGPRPAGADWPPR